jgi:hypothetical protein
MTKDSVIPNKRTKYLEGAPASMRQQGDGEFTKHRILSCIPTYCRCVQDCHPFFFSMTLLRIDLIFTELIVDKLVNKFKIYVHMQNVGDIISDKFFSKI